MNKNNKSVFDYISRIYGLFYYKQKEKYNLVLDIIQEEYDFSNYKNIADIGCGTAALSSVFNERGFNVVGLDSSQKMLDIAIEKKENKKIKFINANFLEKLPFDDNSFDISIAAFVAHGLKSYERKVMYEEMNRITKYYVIFHDYNKKRSFFTDIIEGFEGGDYFNFINVAIDEMKEKFRDVQVINVANKVSWYICKSNNKKNPI